MALDGPWIMLSDLPEEASGCCCWKQNAGWDVWSDPTRQLLCSCLLMIFRANYMQLSITPSIQVLELEIVIPYLNPAPVSPPWLPTSVLEHHTSVHIICSLFFFVFVFIFCWILWLCAEICIPPPPLALSSFQEHHSSSFDSFLL